MSTPERDRGEMTGWYVYGIVPADAEADPEVHGVGDPPGAVELVRHGEIAALVSEIRTDRPLGTPDDLLTHERLLDAAAPVAPVLPLRFGAALISKDAVAEELLAPHHDEFQAAMRELEGVAEYLVHGRYDEATVLSEVLRENPEAEQLREQIRETPEDAARDLRIALGELVGNAIAAKRESDTRQLVEALSPYARSNVVREPTHEWDAAHVAFLVETERHDELEQAVADLAQQWEGRVELRLLGPLAAYDFVTTPQPAG